MNRSHQELNAIMEREHLTEEAKTEMINVVACLGADHVRRSTRERRICVSAPCDEK